MAWDHDRAQQRFRDFIAEVERDMGGAHGWRTSVASRLGITLPHFSRILAGKRRVGATTLERAAEQWGFTMDYFASESGSYRDFPSDGLPKVSEAEPSPLSQHRRNSVPAFAESTFRRLAPAVVAAFSDLPPFARFPRLDVHRELARAVLSLPFVKHAMAIAECTDPEDPEFAIHALALEADATALLAALSPYLRNDENMTKG